MKFSPILTICSVLISLASSAQKKNEITVPDSIQAVRYAKVFHTEEDDQTKKITTELSKVYCFDSMKNIIYTFDQQGLKFAYEYDSLNNLTAEYFYEEIDPKTNLRVISAKATYSYSKGLMENLNWYTFVDGAWIDDGSTRNSYKLDKYGRVTQNSFFSDGKLRKTTTYSYPTKIPKGTVKLDFNTGWLTVNDCSREVEKDASGKTISVRDFKYDSLGNCIRIVNQDFSEKGTKRITTTEFTYSTSGFLLDETVYLNINGIEIEPYSVKRIWEYDEQGFVLKYTSKDSNNLGSVDEYKYFRKH